MNNFFFTFSNNFVINMIEQDELIEYKWIVAFGGFAAMFAAFGIGANDVANAYATSVGSKALTIKQACALALIFEFVGAVAAGSQVANTIRKGIADIDCYNNNYMDAPLLMYGNGCVCFIVGMWLVTATWLEMPVSTTHSCVGGMIGMAIAIRGQECVVWYENGDEDNLWIPKGVVGIIISWFVSPILSGLFSVMFFTFVRTFILRSTNSFNRALKFYPILIFLAVWINIFFIISKGISKKICPKKDGDNWLCESGTKKKDGKVIGEVAMGLSAALSIIITFLVYPAYGYIRKWINEDFKDGNKPWYAVSLMLNNNNENNNVENENNININQRTNSYTQATSIEQTDIVDNKLSIKQKILKYINKSINVDVHNSSLNDQKVVSIHEHAEVFDDKTEAVFRYIQIFTAICDSFAHGANDVANAIGPFMACYLIYKDGKVDKKKDTDDDAYWILALGGIGIGIGLLLYGYKIIRAIGVKLSKITPSRGFAIELGAALVIIIGSYLGLPLSTTHCQIGATTGVALLEGQKGLNKKVFGVTIIGWVITLIVAGIGSGLLTAQGIYAPLAPKLQRNMEQEQCLDYAASIHDWLKVNETGTSLYKI